LYESTGRPQSKERGFLIKTAILKTKFWDSQEFDKLHLDSKMVYFYLLSSPSRGIADIFYVNKKVAQAHTGLDITHIEKGITQLVEVGLIAHKDSYFRLLTDAVEPKKGRFTEVAIKRELKEIPQTIIDYLRGNSTGTIPDNSTGTLPVHIDKDIDKDNNKDISNNKSKPEINELFADWFEIVGYEIESNKQKNRYACSNLLKKHGRDKLKQLLRGVALTQSDQFAPRIADFISLQSKLNELLLWGKKKGTSQNASARF